MRAIVLALAMIGVPLEAAAGQTVEPVEIMVLGTYHFANPGRDLINIEADDVTAPRRQAELAALSAALVQWRPTRVVVEVQRPGPTFEDERFRAFTPALLASNRSEVVQIGYRVAHAVGLRAVHGFDEQPGEGEPDYFPFEAVRRFAETHGEGDTLAGLMAQAQNMVAARREGQEERSIAANLIRFNTADAVDEDQQFYYRALTIGDGDQQVGAELNAYWYMRNAKMFAKLGLIAEPGDRVLVVVGSGHSYWLRHFAETTPGYRLVDPVPWLERAAASGAGR